MDYRQFVATSGRGRVRTLRSIPAAITLGLLGAVALPAQAQVAIGSIGDTHLYFTGQLQADVNWYDSDTVDLDSSPRCGNTTDCELKSAQFGFAGKSGENLSWSFAYDAADMEWKNVDARYQFGANKDQYIQAGQFKQPMGLEELAGSSSGDYLTDSFVTSAFTPSRRLGVAYGYNVSYEEDPPLNLHGQKRDGNWSATVSYFGRELNQGEAEGNGFAGRVTFAPINEEGRILHFGLSGASWDTPDGTARLRARPDAGLTDERLVDTGNLKDVTRQSVAGAASFFVYGPLKLQGEYMATVLSRSGGDVHDFHGDGGYVSGIWNMTGQTWTYRGARPILQTDKGRGAGVWQLGLRYDTINLNDDTVEGGTMNSWTAAVAWYKTQYFKLMLNYVSVDSERKGKFDNPDITEARMQIAW